MLALDSTELKTYLDAATSDELRALRAHIGFGCAGTKDMNKGLIWDHLEKQRRGVSLTKSPEGREGRERAIRPGAAAAALRVEAAKTARLTESDLEDDSVADFSKPMPAFRGQTLEKTSLIQCKLMIRGKLHLAVESRLATPDGHPNWK